MRICGICDERKLRAYQKQKSPLTRALYKTTDILVADEGKQCYVACSLDCISEFSLVLSASTGYAAGENFGTFRNELSESCNIFVVDLFNFFSAENANFLSSAVCSILACGSLFEM